MRPRPKSAVFASGNARPSGGPSGDGSGPSGQPRNPPIRQSCAKIRHEPDFGKNNEKEFEKREYDNQTGCDNRERFKRVQRREKDDRPTWFPGNPVRPSDETSGHGAKQQKDERRGNRDCDLSGRTVDDHDRNHFGRIARFVGSVQPNRLTDRAVRELFRGQAVYAKRAKPLQGDEQEPVVRNIFPYRAKRTPSFVPCCRKRTGSKVHPARFAAAGRAFLFKSFRPCNGKADFVVVKPPFRVSGTEKEHDGAHGDCRQAERARNAQQQQCLARKTHPFDY